MISFSLLAVLIHHILLVPHMQPSSPALRCTVCSWRYIPGERLLMIAPVQLTRRRFLSYSRNWRDRSSVQYTPTQQYIAWQPVASTTVPPPANDLCVPGSFRSQLQDFALSPQYNENVTSFVEWKKKKTSCLERWARCIHCWARFIEMSGKFPWPAGLFSPPRQVSKDDHCEQMSCLSLSLFIQLFIYLVLSFIFFLSFNFALTEAPLTRKEWRRHQQGVLFFFFL